LARITDVTTTCVSQIEIRGDAPSPLSDPYGIISQVRTHRLVIAGLLVAAGVGIDALPGYAAPTGLTVSPGQGSPDTEFTATFRYSSQVSNNQCGSDIPFGWDGSTLGHAKSVADGDSCVATLRKTPPPGSHAGNHTISVKISTGGGNNGKFVYETKTTYTVTAGPAPIPPAGENPPGAHASSTAAAAAASGSASPGRSKSAAPGAANPEVSGPSDPTAQSDTAGQPAFTAGQPSATGNGDAFPTGWLIAAGTVLLLGGAAWLGVMRWRARRPVSDSGTGPASAVTPGNPVGPDNTVVLSAPDAVTQQLPTVAQGGGTVAPVTDGGQAAVPAGQPKPQGVPAPQPTAQITPTNQPEPATAPIAQPKPQATPADQAQPAATPVAQPQPPAAQPQPEVTQALPQTAQAQPQPTPPAQRKPQAAPLAQRKPQVN
jgi:hypothetical protein